MEVLQFTNLFKGIFDTILNQNITYIKTEIFCVLPLIFIASAVYYSVFKMKISGFLGLYNNQQSDAVSLLFFSMLCTKIAAPLCFNFLSMIKIREMLYDTQYQMAFFLVMGDIDNVLILGDSFTTFFPTLLVILCLFHLFNIYGKCMNLVGLKKYNIAFDEEFEDEEIGLGEKLLKTARMQRERIVKNYMTARRGQGGTSYQGYSAKMFSNDSKRQEGTELESDLL